MRPGAPAAGLAGAAAAAFLVLLGLPGAAQTVRVTSGEHGDFTRIVLQSSEAIDWTLGDDGRRREVRVAGGRLAVDPAALFRVIPRTRLADLRATGGGLELVLNCDCDIRTHEPGTGVVVFDIHDGPAASAPRRPETPRRTGAATAALSAATAGVARTAGGDLARRMRSARPAPVAADDASPASAAFAPGSVLEHMSRELSQAVAQGLLTAESAQRTAVMPAANPPLAGSDPSHMRITLATAPLPEGAGGATAAAGCPAADLLDFAPDENAPSFSARHAELMRGLYGEFDLPDAAGHAALARLYLEHGFGAEARLVLENAPAQVSGRDLLLGVSDILEDRYSNARLRLSERIDCGASASLFAALAGAAAGGIVRQAMPIAEAFAALPPPLRTSLGEGLVRRLLDSGAREAARMVADTLRHSSGASTPDMTLIDALLDAARGDVDRAAERLDQDGRSDARTLEMRLRLALDRGEDPDPRLLGDAEAVAASERTTDTGIALMSSLVRVHVAASRTAEAFRLLDRLQRWLPDREADDANLADLREASWAGLIATAEDRDLLQTVFERGDWRSAALTEPTRLALAGRLLDFGLTDPAAELLTALDGVAARRLRARALLATGDFAAARDALAGLGDAASDALRAKAQRGLAQAGAATAPAVDDPDAAETEAASEIRIAAEPGIMARGTALLSESLHLRESLDALLQTDR